MSVFIPHLFQTRIFSDKWNRFLRAGCPPCHPTNSNQALKELKPLMQVLNQEKSANIFNCSTTGLLRRMYCSPYCWFPTLVVNKVKLVRKQGCVIDYSIGKTGICLRSHKVNGTTRSQNGWTINIHSFVQSLVLNYNEIQQCFDDVGWVAERAYGL